MTDKLTERIGIPLTTTMLEAVRASAKRNGRKVLDEIRYLIQRGLETEAKRDVEARLKTVERELQTIKEASPVYSDERPRVPQAKGRLGRAEVDGRAGNDSERARGHYCPKHAVFYLSGQCLDCPRGPRDLG